MTTELLIFVGYGQDAKDEALAVCELKPLLQETLRHLNQVASTRSTYSTLNFFNWQSDAAVGVGGQSFAITPHLERAAIAVFVFKERVGPVSWEELNNCRHRPLDKRIPTFVLFPNEPPAANRMTNRGVARSWADLLDKRDELIQGWTEEASNSVTPLEPYRDIRHLSEVLMKRIGDLLPSLIVPSSTQAILEDAAKSESLGSPYGNYLDSIASFAQCDPQAIQEYRKLLRENSLQSFPSELSDDEFLLKAGYLKSGRPTIAAALLFGRKPSNLIPSALIRCSKYDGDNRATSRSWRNCDGPLFEQIVEARKFIGSNIGSREMPVGSSMQPETSYAYPMICVREVLANAVCHRDYQDQERLIYVTVYSDRIEIKSPGSWARTQVSEGKTLKLSALIGESVQRNMRLAHAISSVRMMEVEGSGIPTAVRDCTDCDAPEPLVEWRDGYVVVTVYPRDEWEGELEPDAFGQAGPDGSSMYQQAIEEVTRLKNQLEDENTYLQEEIKQAYNFDEIVGRSDATKYVLFKIAQVAPTTVTVLITGETGTGKELVARAIHGASPRRDRPLVRVNCAALSHTLIESELFGHERGAFTGARVRMIGRFELANGATIFLDEIGELPLELQVKLLRVIQEGEFERLGSSKTIKVDVRIIAATNRNLIADVEHGDFREDLWYRLNVFPIVVPPLRDRKEDIPLLVEHFVRKFSLKVGRTISTIPPASLRILEDYSWPGNVRELANVLERAVINTSGAALRIVDQFEKPHAEGLLNSDKTLAEMEKEYIIRILDNTSWRIEGGRGAARILGLNPSTLRRRMAKLGIRKPAQRALSAEET